VAIFSLRVFSAPTYACGKVQANRVQPAPAPCLLDDFDVANTNRSAFVLQNCGICFQFQDS